jgi:BirA family biotin operon repressor/biotin-[acetyl-CoA-carboxylase] ligase
MFPAVSFALEIVAECPSTQEILLARRGGPGFHGSALVALRQSAGYGRRGRSWAGGEGNLALSFGLELPPGEGLALLPFACGLAVFDTARAFLPPMAELRLKWPNDVYLQGRKLAGLLAQGRQVPGGAAEVVVGVGLNLAEAPGGLDQEAIALSALGAAPGPEAFARALLERLDEILAAAADFSWLRERWEAAARLGEGELAVLGEGASVRPRELLPTGELLVEEKTGALRKLASEEVSIRFTGRGL